MPQITYRKALNDAFVEEILRDENVIIMGEEVAEYNGAYKVTEGLWKRFGDRRIIDTPISEAAFVGLGVGAAMMGLRPVIEMMFWSFIFVAYDQLVNNAGFIRYMSGGLINIPMVVRGPANGGTNVGATHSHTPENMLANIPGLKVVCPATAYDAKGLMKTAIRDNDTVCVMENTLLYNEKWEVPEEEYTIPLGVADIKREGTDISFIAFGRAVLTCLKAAEILQQKHGINAEVLDLRSIRPLDEDSILRTVSKTHRAVVVEENKPFCGIGAQIAATIQEKAFDELDAPVLRVSALDAPAIYSPPIEKLQLPTPERVIKRALEIL
ncbi:MAG: alpha-ketoacid dehydrogenase subunit beta [Chthoniobacterales bacterium]|nr:alpha-ketoacid dehydrogenase subunit beta [Chthoniobacterales bacterium]